MTGEGDDGVPGTAGTFGIRPVGPYSLASSVRFLEGFAPAALTKEVSRGGSGSPSSPTASPRETKRSLGFYVYPEGDEVVGEVYGEADVGVVCAQVGRVLSLDVDGSGFPEVGEREPVVRNLQTRYPGLRPVLFYSPYEAAAWAIIGQRIRIVQAAKIKSRMAEELGTAVEIRGGFAHAFPGPSRLLELEAFPGLTPVKVERLKSLAEAALEGKLDAGYLRSLLVEEAFEELQRLPGIGPFSAELILLRGAGGRTICPNTSRGWRGPWRWPTG